MVFELLTLLGASQDQVLNSGDSTLAHRPFISVAGVLASRTSGSQPALCLLC